MWSCAMSRAYICIHIVVSSGALLGLYIECFGGRVTGSVGRAVPAEGSGAGRLGAGRSVGRARLKIFAAGGRSVGPTRVGTGGSHAIGSVGRGRSVQNQLRIPPLRDVVVESKR